LKFDVLIALAVVLFVILWIAFVIELIVHELNWLMYILVIHLGLKIPVSINLETINDIKITHVS
jgi:predicted tellurium resistance membrane protein TerC